MGEKLTRETAEIMDERFGCDTLLSLATVEDGIPSVRTVNSYYEEGAFYVITYALSNKDAADWEGADGSSLRRVVHGPWHRRKYGACESGRE